MEQCVKCLREDNQVKLVDAIYGGEIVKICEECAAREDFPIIRRPSSFQLKEAEKSSTVYQRLSRMAGIKPAEVKKPEIKGITLDRLRPAKSYSQLHAERMTRATKINKPLDLIDNFNWAIQMARRERKLSPGQLAEMIGETESIVKMLESGNLPDDASKILDKLEQALKIKLRKSEVEKEQARLASVAKPARILSFKPQELENITIQDLKKMKNAGEQERQEREYASRLVWQGGDGKKESEEKKNEDIEIIEE